MQAYTAYFNRRLQAWIIRDLDSELVVDGAGRPVQFAGRGGREVAHSVAQDMTACANSFCTCCR